MLFPIHHRHLPHHGGKTISLDASITQRNRAPTVPWRKGLLDWSLVHGEVGWLLWLLSSILRGS